MLGRLKIGFRRSCGKAIHELPNSSALLPRLWLILLVLALPFFGISAHYFEVLERSGALGALIADTMFPAMLVGYLVLLYMLKQHRI